MTKEIKLPLTCRQLLVLVCLIPPVLAIFGHLADNVWVFAAGVAFLIVESIFLLTYLTLELSYKYSFSCKCSD